MDKNTAKVRIITHFPENERGDYTEVSIEIQGKEIIRYGDSYHDSGRERAAGFMDAFKLLYTGKYEVEYVNVADAEAWG